MFNKVSFQIPSFYGDRKQVEVKPLIIRENDTASYNSSIVHKQANES